MKNLLIKNINKDNLRKYSIYGLLILLIILISYVMYFDNNVKKTKAKLDEINATCNAVYNDIEGSEKKYSELFEGEVDSFKKGMYASALVQVNTIKGNYDGMAKYGELAVENYLKVPMGSIYAISENKYLAWAMFKVGKYSESLKIVNQLTELIQSDKSNLLTFNEVMDTKALICTIYLNIYSEFDLMDEAKVHYDILNSLELPEAVKQGRGDKIAYSKMLYAMKIENYQLMKVYADECYKIAVENDREFGTNIADKLKINCAIANIEVGNYKEALKDIKIAEAYVKKTEDLYSMVHIYDIYAKYYNKLNNIEKSYENYINAIEIAKYIEGDIRLESLLKDFIELCEANNITENLNVYREDYFNLTSISEVDIKLKEIIVEASKYNDSLNNVKINKYSHERNSLSKKNFIYISIIIVLLIMLLIMLFLLKIIKDNEKKLEKLITIDNLTKAYSRSYGYILLEEATKSKNQFLLAMIDIDNFKSINDSFGHLVGDEVLVRVSNLFLNKNNCSIIRFGGEEFLVIFDNISKSQGIDILNKVKVELNELNNNNLIITFSAGVKEYDSSLTIDENIENVDRLLYEAKKSGKNCVKFS